MEGFEDFKNLLNDIKIDKQKTYQLLDILAIAGIKEATLAKKGFILNDKIYDLLLNSNIINNNKKIEILEAFLDVIGKNLDEQGKKLERI